jgi:hypothetical protein
MNMAGLTLEEQIALRDENQVQLVIGHPGGGSWAPATVNRTVPEILKALQSHDSLTAALLEARREAERYRKALNKINSTNGLQYSDFFEICDQALSARRRGES